MVDYHQVLKRKELVYNQNVAEREADIPAPVADHDTFYACYI